jgi:hypothetical protein
MVLHQGPAVAQAAEQHPLPVRRPAVDLVVVAPPLGERPPRRIEGELLGYATRHRHDVDLLISIVLPGEGDGLPVGRELGEQLETRMGRESGRRAARDRSQPEIAAVGEDDLVRMDIGEAEQLGLGGCAEERPRDRTMASAERKAARASIVIGVELAGGVSSGGLVFRR